MTHFSFRAISRPKCNELLMIKHWNDNVYYTIDEFANKYPNVSNDELARCTIKYNDEEKIVSEYWDDYKNFVSQLQFVQIHNNFIIINSSVNAALYYAEKAADCLQNARYFTIKSASHLEPDSNISWLNGYSAIFHFRCVYFGTACTWYANCFDYILQMVYWNYNLYTSVIDRNKNNYDDSWSHTKTMKYCSYAFVKKELKKRGLNNIEIILRNYRDKVAKVITWNNYLKHKGGVEYKYLNPEKPFEIYLSKIDGDGNKGEFFKIEDFKSPIEINIDEEIMVLKDTHIALYDCICQIAEIIDFNQYSIFNGGRTNGQTQNANP